MKRVLTIVVVLLGLLLLGELAVRLTSIGHPQGGPIRGRSHPRLGWSFEPGDRVACEAGATTPAVTFTLNQQGLRGSAMPPTKPAGTLRVLVLGGAGALGFGVPDPDTIAAGLAKGLSGRGLKVTAAAAGGDRYSLDQLLLLFRERCARLRPDLVVLVLGQTDLEALRHGVRLGRPKPLFEWLGENRLATPSTPLAGEGWNGSALLRLLAAGGPAYPCGAGRIPAEYGVFILDEPAPVKDAWKRAAVLLARLRDEIKRAGALPLATVIPHRLQLMSRHLQMLLDRWGVDVVKDNNKIYIDRPSYHFARICQGLGVVYVDSVNPCRRVPDAHKVVLDSETGHPTALGSRFLARLLVERLVRLRWHGLKG